MSNAQTTSSSPTEQLPTHTDWPQLLEWVEKQAQESMKAAYVTVDLLAKESQTTLTVLLAAVGASAGYGAKVFEPGCPGPVAFASAVVCVYLVFLSVGLVLTCMRFRDYPALYQEPKNLMQQGFPLSAIREAELKNLGERIAEAKKINVSRAGILNRFRIATAVSPFLFAAAAALAPPASPPAQEKASVSCKVTRSVEGYPISFNCEMRR